MGRIHGNDEAGDAVAKAALREVRFDELSNRLEKESKKVFLLALFSECFRSEPRKSEIRLDLFSDVSEREMKKIVDEWNDRPTNDELLVDFGLRPHRMFSVRESNQPIRIPAAMSNPAPRYRERRGTV